MTEVCSGQIGCAVAVTWVDGNRNRQALQVIDK
jgi:hypothetical protein